jgi:uncharacterized SAM-binding protein YcdF (DUF218 family)
MLLRALRLLVLLGLLAFVGGFAVFAERATRRPAPEPPPSADGVVALTGLGGARLATAMGLLERGAAERLLITGINPAATDEDIRRVALAASDKFDCCVDLDRTARTTVGNAIEAASWARENGYGSLLVVTSDFHMPRSLLELDRAIADGSVTLTPYPVRTDDAAAPSWWRDPRASKRLLAEYVKFLTTYALHAAGFSPPTEPRS